MSDSSIAIFEQYFPSLFLFLEVLDQHQQLQFQPFNLSDSRIVVHLNPQEQYQAGIADYADNRHGGVGDHRHDRFLLKELINTETQEQANQSGLDQAQNHQPSMPALKGIQDFVR